MDLMFVLSEEEHTHRHIKIKIEIKQDRKLQETENCWHFSVLLNRTHWRITASPKSLLY